MKFRAFLLLLIFIILPACGFHLKGSSQIADRLNPLFIVQDGLSSTQLVQIRKELTRSTARLTDLEQGTNRLLVRLSALRTAKIASSSLTDVELVQLTMNIEFSVQSESGSYLVVPDKQVQVMEVELDNANILGNEQILNRAQQVLQRRLIQNMISQLSR